MEFNLMQTNLNNMLEESNKNLKNSENANNTLRSQLLSLKNRSNYSEKVSNEEVQALQLKLNHCILFYCRN